MLLPLQHNDSSVSGDCSKANIFNKFLHSVFRIEDSNTLSSLCQSMEAHPELINSIDFPVDEGHKELLNLQKDKACGPD